MKLISVFLFFFSIPLFANDLNMQTVRDECQSQNWAQKNCEFTQNNAFNMDYYNTRRFTTGVVDLGGLLGTLTEQMDNINNPELSCVGDAGRLARLSQYTRNIVNRRQLTPCQKACAVKCITANYITYQRSNQTGINQDSACQAANSGRGVCRAFANLADHLLGQVGVPSRTASNDHHSYNRVRLNGSWLYLEPQDPECRFSRR